MTLNSSHRAIIEQRREAVARLRVRGRSIREIQAEMAAEGLVNPADGEPWSVGTVTGDIKALEKRWQAAAAADIAAHKARQLARLEEHYREAWTAADLREVRENVKLSMALLGTEAPKQTQLTGVEGGALAIRMTWGEGDDDSPAAEDVAAPSPEG